jgi:CDP-paratose 2-epimerase
VKILVTGSSGLIGSEAVKHFDLRGHTIFGIDNNLRAEFFGPAGDTKWNLSRLMATTKKFSHLNIDIRDRQRLLKLFEEEKFDVVIHCAAQPSHDKAREIPFVDFDVNAVGTFNLLEATRKHTPEAAFIFMSTNKVYGDAPNEIPLIEKETRWDYLREEDYWGVSESCRIDQCLHSLFGASKVAADIAAQEYGRYFGMNIGIFRGGCLTGSGHSGVELHGFLSYLVKVAVSGGSYTIFGYKGKQVRDQIHSSDVISAFEHFIGNPKQGQVYNLGGGRSNAASVLECIAMVEEITGHKLNWQYQDANRTGDHICYISDLRKLQSHFPGWSITRDLSSILQEMVNSERARLTTGQMSA